MKKKCDSSDPRNSNEHTKKGNENRNQITLDIHLQIHLNVVAVHMDSASNANNK